MWLDFLPAISKFLPVESFVETFTKDGKPLIFWCIASYEKLYTIKVLNMPHVQPFTMTSNNPNLWNIVEAVPEDLKELEPMLSNAICNRRYQVSESIC